jgi:serpin B
VYVYLPKFKMTTGPLELKGILKAMGMKDAFSMAADFSGMSGNKDLFVSNVLHKAFMAVDEKGTEAAAATAVVVTLKEEPAASPVFRADHPFVFVIKDNRSGSILFIGRVVNPAKQA